MKPDRSDEHAATTGSAHVHGPRSPAARGSAPTRVSRRPCRSCPGVIITPGPAMCLKQRPSRRMVPGMTSIRSTLLRAYFYPSCGVGSVRRALRGDRCGRFQPEHRGGLSRHQTMAPAILISMHTQHCLRSKTRKSSMLTAPNAPQLTRRRTQYDAARELREQTATKVRLHVRLPVA